MVLFKLYETITTTSKITNSSKISFIHDEINNQEQYIKFVHSSTQITLFKLLSHYQTLWSRGEQNTEFWNEVTKMFVEKKNNTETLWNRYFIFMYQGSLPHEPYFIAIDNWGLAIIGPNNKIVAIHVVGEHWSNSYGYECWKQGIVTINTLWMQNGLGSSVMMTQLAVLKKSQLASHVVSVISLL